MKAILGVLSLLVVLAVAALFAKQQLLGAGVSARAASQSTSTADSGQRGAGDAASPHAIVAAPNQTVQQLTRDMQQRARDDTARALQQGVERNQQADR